MQDEALAPTAAEAKPSGSAELNLVLADVPVQPAPHKSKVILPAAVERLRRSARMAKVTSLADILPPREQQKPIEEYDVAPQPATPGSVLPNNEALTKEDGERLRKGDVERVAERPVALTSGKEISVAAASATALQSANPMQDQCLEFAKWARAAGVHGSELAKLWQSTCEPAVKAGGASDKFVEMCGLLPKVMAEFSANKDWEPKRACDTLVAHFKASGVGADPVLGS